MTLIIGILFTIVFYSIFADYIKKYAGAFYIGVYVWTGLVIFYFNMGYDRLLPAWFNKYFMNIFSRGIFATATFMIVMFLGTITKHNSLSKKLMKARGEISIIASLLVISHNIIFGVHYFPVLFTNPGSMDKKTLIATIITILLLLMLIPLFVTSFQCVRKRMKPTNWKKLQKLAYPFFIGIYIHIMILYSQDWKAHLSGIIIYTIIYTSYVVLRLRKQKFKRLKTSVK